MNIKRKPIEKTITYTVIIILISVGFIPIVTSQNTDTKAVDDEITKIINESVLDLRYIYNLTEALSNIIFTEYDEENGDIPKGRAFGTKGEHKAAEILYENMTKLGLHTWKEQIYNVPNVVECSELTHKLEILDYNLALNHKSSCINENVSCFVLPTWSEKGKNNEALDSTISFKDMKVILSPKFPLIINKTLANEEEDFIFIKNPDSRERTNLIRKFLGTLGLGGFAFFLKVRNEEKNMRFWNKKYPNCRGFIDYDHHDDTYDMKYREYNLPVFYVNGSIGKKLIENINDYTVDIYLEQRYNESIESYNVVGQLNGTDPSKTVIIGCLYDSWWCPGTTDSAIGMSIALSIAKYFIKNNITPKYNVKFIGFCGEEYGMRGSKHYEATHKDEEIIYVIDFNQLGYLQENPRPTLEIAANKRRFLLDIWDVAQETNYKERTDDSSDISPKFMPIGHISDDRIFASKRPRCKTICFLKNNWELHHRCGMNYTEGDVLKYFYWADVSATSEIALNIVKYLIIKN